MKLNQQLVTFGNVVTWQKSLKEKYGKKFTNSENEILIKNCEICITTYGTLGRQYGKLREWLENRVSDGKNKIGKRFISINALFRTNKKAEENEETANLHSLHMKLLKMIEDHTFLRDFMKEGWNRYYFKKEMILYIMFVFSLYKMAVIYSRLAPCCFG
jgi:hypothetical protein